MKLNSWRDKSSRQQALKLLQQWDIALQQVEVVLQQWDKALQQVQRFLQQWDWAQQQVIILQLSLGNTILQVHQQQVQIHFLLLLLPL